MPTIQQLRVYPIKSLDGFAVDEAHIWPGGGLANDREFALFASNHRALTAKTHAKIQRVRASFDLPNRLVTLTHNGEPELFHLDEQGDSIGEWFSDFLGEVVTFRHNDETGFPDDYEYSGPTLLSTATLREVSRWFGLELEDCRRRFRANIEMGGDGVYPFWEDCLIGLPHEEKAFYLGDVEVRNARPCARCPVPSRDPNTGEPLSGFQKYFAEQRRATMPDSSPRDAFGHFFYLALNTYIPYYEKGKALRVGQELGVPV